MTVDQRFQDMTKILPISKKACPLRDYFAAKAMQGLLTATDSEGEWMGLDSSAAKYAYETADAMIAERNKHDT